MTILTGAAPFEGSKFKDSEVQDTKTPWDLAKFIWSKPASDWPKWRELKQLDKPPANVPDKALRATFVNHATVLLQTEGLNILTDPVWSDRVSPVSFAGPKRVHAPGIRFEDLPKINIVLVSHSHYDHLDLPTLQRLETAFQPTFFVGLKVSSILRPKMPQAKIVEMDWDSAYDIGPQQKVHFLKAQHWSARSPFDRNKTLWGAFAVELPGGNIYFAGDTGYGKHFKAAQAKLGSFRLALIPIGAYEPRWFMKYQHMNPADAMQAFHDLNATNAIGIHHGCFPLSYEKYLAPGEEIAKFKDVRFAIPEPGEAKFF
ncbi:MAG: MBL fold metallo-hydrolase [Myxococcota bacterium]